LTAILGNRIELALDLDSAPAWVRVDPGQLELVLTNLALNSREAMPNGGRLVLTTALVTVTDASAHSGLRAGSYVLLSLRDTGCGMTPEVKAHLFEPFFTTKSRAKGSGLGLSTAYGIIKQTGGHIEVESEPNQGATLKVYLPHAVGPGSELEMPEIALPSESPVPAERPTILLVEDADAVRVMLLKLLERSGYHVLSAEDGVDALVVRARHAGPIRLLITDVVMPKMNGRELAEKLQQIEPGLNVLFISGFTDNILDQATQGFPSAGFLQKPFSTEVFLRKVQELMEAAL
jgi:two-component system cell cycle sensor histidine kinase/response regulator CckA